MSKLFLKTIFLLTGIGALLLIFNQRELKSADNDIAYKTQSVLANATSVNTVFLGSSATKHTFDPQLFDSLMRANNVSATSYNFGMNQMKVLDLQYHMEKLFAHNLPNLRYVVFELSYPNPHAELSSLNNWRFIETHDWKRFKTYCTIFWQQFGGRSRFTSILTRFYVLVRNITLAGRAEQLVESLTTYQTEINPPTPHFRAGKPDGFRPLDIETKESILNGRITVNPTEKENLINSINLLAAPEQLKKYRKEDKLLLEVYKTIAEQCKEHGIQPIFLIPPKPFDYLSLTKEFKKSGINAPLIVMNDPNKFPELFKIQHWYDGAHLNWAGAKLATETLAQLMLRLPEFSKSQQTESPVSIDTIMNQQ